jgi:hypothetical protein
MAGFGGLILVIVVVPVELTLHDAQPDHGSVDLGQGLVVLPLGQIQSRSVASFRPLTARWSSSVLTSTSRRSQA